MLAGITPKGQKGSKLSVLIIFIIIIGGIGFYFSQSNPYANEQLDMEEFRSMEGVWEIVEYLGAAVEYQGAEESETNQEILDTTEKYLNKKLYLKPQNVIYFLPPTELGYYCSDWDELFFIYRQPANGLEYMVPPFLCASISLKDCDDYLDIIIDADANALLSVKGQFFQLEKVIY